MVEEPWRRRNRPPYRSSVEAAPLEPLTSKERWLSAGSGARSTAVAKVLGSPPKPSSGQGVSSRPALEEEPRRAAPAGRR